MSRELTKEEKEIIEWLDSIEEYRISWDSFKDKVEETLEEDESIKNSESFNFQLEGVTVTVKNGNRLYPVRDLKQGIIRGYSTD